MKSKRHQMYPLEQENIDEDKRYETKSVHEILHDYAASEEDKED